uniref:Uncharacterized protein n=1 Tax=Arundo donax TaxID=35708 RepID=A0A0A9G2M6_ARUDO
MERSVTTSS